MPPRVAASLLVLASCAASDGLDFDDLCFGKCDGISLEEHSGPALLEWSELVQLSPLPGRRQGASYTIDNAPAGLVDKVNRLLVTPFVNNEAFKAGTRPHHPTHDKLGATVDVAFWNIERGQQLPAIRDVFAAAQDSSARDRLYSSRIKPEARTGDARAQLDKQLDALGTADVIVLNEVDRYMKRSGYTDVVAELGKALDMNWTWGAEFIEIDPVALGIEKFQRQDFLDYDTTAHKVVDNGVIPEADLQAETAEANQLTAVDSTKSRNVHGNAILSRYPIVKARVIPLQTVCWDWNSGERTPRSFIQEGKNIVAEKLFLEKWMRQIRHGGRNMLIADLYVPGLTAQGTTMEHVAGVRENTLTVVTAHLEAVSSPACRAKQMAEVMAKIAEIKNPVVFGGDLNTFGSDGRPTTIESLLRNRVTDWQYITRKVLGRLLPYSGWVFTAADIINWVRLKDDPTGVNVPLLLPNPEKGLFDTVEKTTFADGAKFDFRGDHTRTVNATGKTLANSNQRDDKGFKTTSSLARTIGIGKLAFVGKWKLDWIFARGYARAGRDTKASYRMAPHLPRTLEELQLATIDPATGTAERLSDHAPLTVVLPIKDPCAEGSTCSGDDAGTLEFGDTTWTDANTLP